VLRRQPQGLASLGVVDDVIPEPLGGAHRDHHEMANTLKTYLLRYLRELRHVAPEMLLERRYEKFRRMGVFLDGGLPYPGLNGAASSPS